jgi:hypothetical protein
MRFLITLLLSASSLCVFSQQPDSISNSFESTYRKSNPTLKYNYDNNSQIHNYSGNWEFKFAESDFPIMTATDTTNFNQMPLGFVVTHLGKNRTPSIIIRLDEQTYYANKKALTKNNILTKNVVISFENGKTKYSSL